MKARILLIEDNPQNRYLTRFLLEQRGHQVIEAETGPRGLELALEFRPDLILLDIQLPVLDGYEVARTLKDHEELGAIPIIAITSYAMVGDRERCLNAGAVAYLEKPINPDTFVMDVECCLATPQQDEFS